MLLSAVIPVNNALGQVHPGKMLIWQEKGASLAECVHAAVHSCRTHWPCLPTEMSPPDAWGGSGLAGLANPARKGLDKALRHGGIVGVDDPCGFLAAQEIL